MIVASVRPRLGLVVLLLLAACGGDADDTRPVAIGDSLETEARVVLQPPDGDPVTVQVAIADTEEERRRGLMGVEEMPEDAGMVFLHDAPTEGDFWMKDTLIPLSVAVWDESGTIRQIVEMEPCTEDACTVYDITETWIGALEVNRGFFKERGIEVGAKASLQGADGSEERAPAA